MNKIIYRNKIAAAILRVSSGRQKDGTSHDVQEKLTREYCKDLGLELVEVFVITESAKTSEDRKKYHEAMNLIEKKNIGNVLFYMTDRESRNYTDLEINERKVKDGKFNIHYVSERKIFHKDSSESDLLSRDMTGLVARSFIRNLSTRVREAMRVKAENGWYPSNNPPLGYVCQKIIDPETGKMKSRGGIIALDPKEDNRKIVIREFELRSQGFSYEKIRKMILEEGLISGKMTYRYKKSSIEHRLKNPFYRGKFQWMETIYEGKHEIFVPKELIKKVDLLNGSYGSPIRRVATENTVLSGGWLKCTCGCHIVYDPKTKINKTTKESKTYHYYRCSNGKKVHPKNSNILDEKIWEQLGGLVDKISISEDFAKDIAEALNKTEKKAHKVVELQIAGFKEQEGKLQQRENSLLDLMLNQQITEDVFKRQLDIIRNDRKSLTNQLEVLQKSLASVVAETAKTILELATSAKSLWISKSHQERRDLLDMILSNPILDGLTVRYELKKPFAVLLKMSEKEEWRPRF